LSQTRPLSRAGLTQLSTTAKATRGQTRLNNLRLALQLVYTESPTSRADIARASRLTPATASDLIDELLELDLVKELGSGPSAGGKPPTLIAPNPEGRSIVAIDLSSNDFRGALLDMSGDIVQTASTSGSAGARGIELASDLVRELAEDAGAPLLGVGIGTPGVVDPATGLVTSANLEWHGADLAQAIATRADAPVHIINDAHAATLHEYSLRPELTSLALIRVGRGIGTGFVLDGHLYRGENAATGEIGHVRFDDGEIECTCGNRGCLETEASMSALLRAVGGDQTLTRARITEISQDRAHGKAVAAAARSLGRGLSSMVGLLAVRDVVLWGEVTSLDDEYRSTVEAEIRDRVLPVNTDRIRVHMAQSSDDAVIRGAGALVLSAELGVVW
jgi:predicted NBD/HSP70 family sugar kinase